jgi:iron(III) transport system ATP-binding protein
MDREALGIEKLFKRFDERLVLADVNLTVRDGECLALLGPSGCGKTTLLRLIAGLDTADAGHIRIHGTLASHPQVVLPPNRRQLAMVFQDLALWPHLTAVQNVEFMLPRSTRDRKQRMARAASLLEAVHLDGHQVCHPYQLSRGQQQRVALARALASEPRLLLLDEPFASQDRELKRELVELVLEMRRTHNVTTLYVTHTAEELPRLADRVAVMESGTIPRVVAIGQFDLNIRGGTHAKP